MAHKDGLLRLWISTDAYDCLARGGYLALNIFFTKRFWELLGVGYFFHQKVLTQIFNTMRHMA